MVKGKGDDGEWTVVMVVVENPDDAAIEDNIGDGVGPCVCQAQLGRVAEPILSLFCAPLSCIHGREPFRHVFLPQIELCKQKMEKSERKKLLNSLYNYGL